MRESSTTSSDGEGSGVDVRLVERLPVAVVLAVVGELTFSSARSFQDNVVRLLGDGDRHVVLDLDGVTFLDSSAVRVVVGLAQRMRERGGKVALVRLTGSLKQRFEMLGLAPLIKVWPTLEDALVALGASRAGPMQPD